MTFIVKVTNAGERLRSASDLAALIEFALEHEYDGQTERAYGAVVRAEPVAEGVKRVIKDALEGNSNDADHDALVLAAEALGVEWDPGEWDPDA